MQAASTPMRPVSEWLADIARSGDPERAARTHAFVGLNPDSLSRLEARGVSTYRGKVRDVLRQGDELYILHSDRLSAFDCFIGHVPYKGVILTALSDHWLRAVAPHVPTHLIERTNERVLRVRRHDTVKAEIIVRGYLAGSMLRAYERGTRTFCGASLPDGLRPHERLPKAIITPTTKAEAFAHDEDTTPDELIRSGVCTDAEWRKLSDMALTMFQLGTELYAKSGWILVDTKYEFGRDPRTGELRVIDEIHTPDSSRLWVAATYGEKVQSGGVGPDMLDKEIVRRYLMTQGFSGSGSVPTVPLNLLLDLCAVYLRVAEHLAGEPLCSGGPSASTAESVFLQPLFA